MHPESVMLWAFRHCADSKDIHIYCFKDDVKMETGLLKLERDNLRHLDDGCIDDEFKGVWFELICPIDTSDENRARIQQGLSDVEQRLSVVNKKVEELNADIETLTNNADGLDYTIAVASGLLTGLIDSFCGEEIKSITDKQINNSVVKKAQKQKIEQTIKKAEETARAKGTHLSKEAKQSIRDSIKEQFTASSDEEEKNVLAKAIRYMENHHKSPTDKVWNYKGATVTPDSHHIDDLSHHASVIGLVASIMTQFTRKSYFVDSSGYFVNKAGKGSGIPITIDENNEELFGTTFLAKIVCGTLNWFWHLVSDVAGTSNNPGAGMGIPGPIMSLAKSVSALPGIRDTKLSEIVNNVFKDARFDFRNEAAQSVTVLMNDLFVRIFYAVRRFVDEYKEKHELNKIAWKNVIPFGNRTIVRMMTIATGTFTAVDMADAGIRAVAKSGVFNPATLSNFVLNVNFVGVGRFAVAVATDVGMGVKKGIKENKRFDLVSQQLQLLNVKVSYQQADVWVSAKDAGKAINEAYQMVVPTVETIATKWAEIDESVDNIVATLNEEAEDEALLDAFLTMFEESQGEV